MAGERRWMSFLNVSANGPATSRLKGQRPAFYPKTAAQLEYTSNDAMYYSRHWQKDEGWPGAVEFTNHDLVDAQFRDVEQAMSDSSTWFGEVAADVEAFDGGGIHFTFSGHGRDDGVLLLAESTYFSPRDLVELAIRAREAAGIQVQTKLVVYLDACHSGKFLLDLWEIVENECPAELGVFRSMASSFPDELSFEVPELGHGLATFCASLRSDEIFGLTAKAGLNSTQTWSVLSGVGGCSLATMGKQNAITIDNYGEMVACNRTFHILDRDRDWKPTPRSSWEESLEGARSEFQTAVAALYGVSPKPEDSLEEHLQDLLTLGGITLRRSILNDLE